jgi:hypothetical protein
VTQYYQTGSVRLHESQKEAEAYARRESEFGFSRSGVANRLKAEL